MAVPLYSWISAVSPPSEEMPTLSYVRNREFARGRWPELSIKINRVEKIVAADTFRSSMAE
jgi:hypothetical protein